MASACQGGIQGHAEVGRAGETIVLGTIGPAVTHRTLSVDVEVTSGSVRIDVLEPNGVVRWTATAEPVGPLQAEVPLAANGGPWRATLLALRAPAAADYRLQPR